jgi:hypothetical protein
MMPSTIALNKTPNFGRRIKWLGAVTALAFALYSAGWFYVAQEGKRRVDDALAESGQSGVLAKCDQSEIKGYPFRLGLFCNAISFEQPQKAISLSAGSLRSAAQVYDPKHVIIELDSPAHVEAPGIKPLILNWTLLHASARLAQPLPERVSIEAQALQIAMREPSGADTNFMSLDYASAHMRTEETNLAFAGEGGGVIINPIITPQRKVPEFATSYDFLVTDGVAIFAAKPKSLRGIKGSLRQSQIVFKTGGTLKLTGPLSVDDSGLLDADLSITLVDTTRLGVALSQIAPEAENVITTMMATVGLGNGADKEAEIEVKIRKGKVSIGFFPLGTIPPLQ